MGTAWGSRGGHPLAGCERGHVGETPHGTYSGDEVVRWQSPWSELVVVEGRGRWPAFLREADCLALCSCCRSFITQALGSDH